MNVFGESFPKEINEQIRIRQKKHSSQVKDDDLNQYLHGNSSWVKLMSSVDIDNQKLINSPLLKSLPNIAGDSLAKEYVLFNGTRPYQQNQRSGIGGANGAYGVGDEFGIRPMPGINSAEIKILTRGSIKTATINITAYNRTQFEIIDILYLRLGFSVLLEWGHTLYYDKQENLTKTKETLEGEFLEGKLNYDNILGKIEAKRLSSGGNYDAMYGIVNNFEWSFENDGTYNITIHLYGHGSIIEALKMDKMLIDEPLVPKTFSPITPFNPNNIIPNIISPGSPQIPLRRNPNIVKFSPTDIEKFFNSQKEELNITSNKNPNNGMSYLYEVISSGHRDFVSQQYVGKDKPLYYIRLGSFIEWFAKYQIPVVDKKFPILKFDIDDNTNLIYVAPLFVSANPDVCIVKTQFQINYKDGNNKQACFAQECDDFNYENINGNTYSKLMNIYINVDHIMNIIKNNREEITNKTTLIQFFDTLLKDISRATGNFNDLYTSIDETTNTVIFRDGTLIPDKNELLKKINPNSQLSIQPFEIYGFSKDKSNFVKNFSSRTEISSKFATLIAYGSNAKNTLIGEDSSVLSKLNRGLKDRTKPEITDSITTNSPIILEQRFPDLMEKYAKYTSYLSSLDNNILPNWDPKSIEDLQVIISDMMYYQQQLHSEKSRELNQDDPKKIEVSPNTGFIPFSPSLTINGLSGMKVYHNFEIDSRFLPSNYGDSLEFYIKSITNIISNNEWLTVIDSFSVPKLTNGYQFKQQPKPAAASNNKNIATQDIKKILKTIRTKETNNNYKITTNLKGSASGAYQITDSTWNNYKNYPKASLAPPEVQDEKATQLINSILIKYNDIEYVPAVWYTGNPPSKNNWNFIPSPQSGNKKTIIQYVNEWLNLYNSL